jgi:2-polyprenyl-6-methoxyphenol hydroxylase-like FAD-dependent oxidoreductase
MIEKQRTVEDPTATARRHPVIEYDVVVAGAGPTGLMLAGELAVAGADVLVVERRSQHDLVGSRAGGMTPRTLEVLDQRGIVERFIDQGVTGQNGHYSGLFFDVSDLPKRHNYGPGLLQHRIERTLADWIGELSVPIRHGRRRTAPSQPPARPCPAAWTPQSPPLPYL